jgi:hypothetical protein
VSKVQAELISQFFPHTREEWRKLHPTDDKPKMTRQEHIDNARVGIEGFPMGLGKTHYNAYRELGWSGARELPTFEEAVFQLKPWLRNDEEFAKWQALEPYDRFRLMVCGLPWDDEVLELLKNDDGPTADRTREEG